MTPLKLAQKIQQLAGDRNPELSSAIALLVTTLQAKQPKSLKPVSKKRTTQNREYTELKQEFLLAHPICQVEGCSEPSEDVHHIRKRNGKRLLEQKHWMAVCRSCHQQITTNPQWAYEMGYLIRVNSREKK